MIYFIPELETDNADDGPYENRLEAMSGRPF